MDQATQVSQQNKAMNTLDARVAVVPGKRAADLGTLQDPNQARSLGLEHWPSKQGVLAGSIGQASKNPAVCWYQDGVERSILVQVRDQCWTYRSAST